MAKGQFHWFELVTQNQDAAKNFYTKALGWGTDSMDMGPGGTYLMFTANEKQVAGVVTPEMEVPQHWISYIDHPDVDAGAKWVAEQGGKVFAEPFDVPTVGRMSVVQDPFGAVFTLFDAETPAEDSDEIALGEFCWSEHTSSDVTAARKFYEELFGWELAETMKSEMGDYHLYKIGDSVLIGMAEKKDAPSYWNYYVKVEDVAKTAESVKSNGGNVLYGPAEIPTGNIVVLQDDQDGVFAAWSA